MLARLGKLLLLLPLASGGFEPSPFESKGVVNTVKFCPECEGMKLPPLSMTAAFTQISY
jgi:hypothetical protein